MKKLRLYLAHSLRTRKVVREIELIIEKRFNIELVNPFYDVDRPEIKEMDKGKQDRFQFSDKKCKEIRKKDLDLIMSCHGLLCIVFDSNKMIGSFKEMCFAHENKKPVYLISFEKYARNHLWNRAESEKRFSSIIAFTDWLTMKGYKKISKNTKITKLKDLKNIKDINHIKFFGDK